MIMSVATRFAGGFSMKEDGKVTYIVPNSTEEDQFLPVDLTILQTEELGDTKKTGRKFYEAYKAEITEDSLRKQWKTNFSDATVNILKEAINGSECFKAGLVYENNTWFLQIIRSDDGKDGTNVLGSICLDKIEIVPSVGRMLETVVVSLMKASEESRVLQRKSKEVSASREKLESVLKNLVHEKAKMEDRLYRAFAKVLNTKKSRIRELEKEIRKLKKRAADQEGVAASTSSAKRLKTASDRPFGVSSSDSEADHEEENTDYDSETDVHDSDSGDSAKKLTVKQGENFSKKGPAMCKRNLFSEEVSAVKSNLKQKSSDKDTIGHESSGSQVESSEEMLIPTEPLRARREEEDAVKTSELLSSKQESQHDQDDADDTQYLAASELSKSDKTCIENEIEFGSQRNLNDKQGSSDDILNQLFGLDSQ